MSEPSARERFVEAMKLAWLYAADSRMADVQRQAVEAFADAACAEASLGHYPTVQEHAACRARLLARVMEEADGR